MRQDGAARLGEITTARGKIRTPAFMPVGTAATVKAVYADQVKAAGADIMLGNTYHLMLRPGRGARRAARRAAQVHALGGPDPHRQRRVSGHEPGQASQDHRGGRRLPVAYRRIAPHADARTVDRDPVPARRRHPDAARRVPRAAGRAGRSGARDGAVARWAERSQRAFERHGRTRAGAVRHRAGRHQWRTPAALGRSPRRRWISRATRSAAWRSAKGRN